MNPPWILSVVVLLCYCNVGNAVPVTLSLSDKVYARGVEDVVLTCTFDAAPDTVKWIFDGEEFTPTGPQETGSGVTRTLTFDKSSLDHTFAGTYSCVGGFSTSSEPSISNSVELKVTDVYLTGYSGPYKTEDNEQVLLTCHYDVYAGQTEPSDPTWYINDDEIGANAWNFEYITPDTTKCGTKRESIYDQGAMVTAAYTDNKNIKCKVTLTGQYAGQSGVELSADVDYVVRHLLTSDVNVEPGGTATFICTIFGGKAATKSWVDDKDVDQTSVGNSVSSDTYDEDTHEQKLTLTISGVTTASQKTYKCKAGYSQGTNPSDAASVLSVYEVTGMTPFSNVVDTETTGSDLTLSCAYNNPSLVSSVKWYKDADLIETKNFGDTGIDSHAVEKLATNTGLWSCIVDYTSKSNVAGTQKRNLYFRKTVASHTTLYVTSGTNVIFRCGFHGDETGPATWYDFSSGSEVLINDGDTGVTQDLGSYSDFERSTTLTLASQKQSGSYICRATYLADGAISSKSLQLSVMDLPTITSTKATADESDEVILECNGSSPPSGATIELNIYFNGGDDPVASLSPSSSTSTLTHKITSATYADNGVYNCKASYSELVLGEDLTSTDLNQYVRAIKIPADTVFAITGQPATIECTFYGDDVFATVAWTKFDDKRAIDDAASVTTSAGFYSVESLSRTHSATIAGFESSLEGDYHCESTSGTTTLTKTQTLKAVGITSLTSDNPNVNEDGTFKLTCTFGGFTGAGLRVTWTKNGADLTSPNVTPTTTGSILTVTSATSADNGVYRCTVKFGMFGTEYRDVTQYVHGVEASASYYRVTGADATLSCTFHGDTVTSVTWTKPTGSTAATTQSSEPVELNGVRFGTVWKLEFTTITDVDTGDYECKGAYQTDINTQVKSQTTLIVLANPVLTSSAGLVETSQSFTLTCKFSVYPGDKTVTLTHGVNIKFSSETVTSHTVTQITRKFDPPTAQYNDQWICKVSYVGANPTGVSENLDQIVRHVTGTDKVFGILGHHLTLSCTFHGDATGSISWYKDSSTTAITSGVKYVIATSTDGILETTETLQILTLDTGDNGVYTCKGSYASDSREMSFDSTLRVSPQALTVQFTRSPSFTNVQASSSIIFTCTFTDITLGADEGALGTVVWYTTSGSIASYTVTTSAGETTTNSITLDKTFQGDLACGVTFGVYGEVRGTNTIVTRAVEMTSKYYAFYGDTESLACEVYGDEPKLAEWLSGDYTGSYLATSVRTNDYLTTKTYDLAATVVPGGVIECKATYDDDSAITAQTTLLTGGSSTIMTPTLSSSNPHPEKAQGYVLTCTFSSGVSGGATITIMDGDTEVKTSNVDTSTTTYTSDMTATKYDPKLYTCRVQYSVYGTKESAALTISPRGIEVSRTVLPTSVFKGHTVTLTCIFHGDEITFNSWKYGSNDLSSSPGTYAINTGSYDSTTGTLTTTVSFLIQDDPHTGESFECKGTYNADSAATTKLQTVVLKTVSVSSNRANNVVSAGTSFRLVCTYTRGGASGNPTITWFKDGVDLTSDSTYSKASCGWWGVNRCLTVSDGNSKGEKTGEYACQAAYPDNQLGYARLIHYVEEAVPAPAIVCATPGAAVTLTCVMHGTLNSDTQWSDKDDSAIDGANTLYEIIAGVISNFRRTDKLIVKSADINIAGSFKCKTAEATQQTVNLYITAVVTGHPSTAYAIEGDDTKTMSCTTTATNAAITDIKWYYGDTLVPNSDVAGPVGNEYNIGTVNTNTCQDSPMFKKITSSNDCNLAANKLNIIFDGTTLSDADSLPSGCIEHQSEARFNTDSTNVASSSSKPICKSEGKRFTSTLTIKGIDTTVDTRDYKCKVTMPVDATLTEESNTATFYRLGLKSIELLGFAGEYIESSTEFVDSGDTTFTEAYYFKFHVLVGPGISSTSMMYGDVTVQGRDGATANNVKIIYYEPVYAKRITGTAKLTVVYDLDPTVTVEGLKDAIVYEYCKLSDLAKPKHGGSSVYTPYVEYHGLVSLVCDKGYIGVGITTSRCEFGATFGVLPTMDDLKCLAESEMSCGELPGIANGYVKYSLDGSSASYVCNDIGLVLMNTETNNFVCDRETGVWSFYSTNNPTGKQPTCTAGVTSQSRKVRISMQFPSSFEYCQTGADKATHTQTFESTLKLAITEANLSECLYQKYCDCVEFTCDHISAKNAINIHFVLEQKAHFSDAGLMLRDRKRLESATISVSIDNPNSKKRAIESLTNTQSESISSIVTTCAGGTMSVENACVKCPAGFGKVSVEDKCEVCPRGKYSDSDNLAECTECPGGKTTHTIGSTDSSDCKSLDEFCKVPHATAETVLIPATGSILPYDNMIKVKCITGYALEDVSPTSFKCTDSAIAPICYRKCDVSMYDDEKVSELNYADEMGPNHLGVSYMRHDQQLNMTCHSGYESAAHRDYDVFRCVGNKDPESAKVMITPCTKIPPNSTLIVGLVLGILLIIVVLVLLWCALKQNRKRKPRREIRTEEAASTKL